MLSTSLHPKEVWWWASHSWRYYHNSVHILQYVCTLLLRPTCIMQLTDILLIMLGLWWQSHTIPEYLLWLRTRLWVQLGVYSTWVMCRHCLRSARTTRCLTCCVSLNRELSESGITVHALPAVSHRVSLRWYNFSESAAGQTCFLYMKHVTYILMGSHSSHILFMACWQYNSDANASQLNVTRK